MGSANEGKRYYATPSLIGGAHTQNDLKLLLCGSHNIRVDSRFAPSQWETALLCNDDSHWLGASLESAMNIIDTLYLIWNSGHGIIV